jgi:hypothetical protein
MSKKTKNRKPVTVDVGGVWEGNSWEVQFNVGSDAYWSKRARWDVPKGGVWADGHYAADWSEFPCPHCFDIKELPPYRPDFHPDEKRRGWTVPRVVVMWNEAGHATTGVCLDCILDWAKFNG